MLRTGKIRLAALLLLSAAWTLPLAADTGTLLPNAEQTFVDQNGAPLAAGSVYFYIPNTSTPKNTWSDQALSSLNSNPVVLDAAGRAKIWGSGTYRQVVKDLFGNTIWDQVTSTVGGSTVTGSLVAVADVAALQAIGAGASSNPYVQTSAYRSGSGIGGGTYLWTASSNVTDCTHIPATGVGSGRYVLQAGLQGNTLLPSQCGAYFDNSHDDITYWQATENAAALYGLVIGCQPGTSKITSDYIRPGVGVVHKGCGVGVETVLQTNTLIPAFYIQNANGTNMVQAPAFYDMTIKCQNSGASFSCLQFNSISGGFTDTAGTQAYMFRPVVKNMEVWGGGTIGGASSYSGSTTGQSVGTLQCSKCFQADFSNDLIHDGQGVGIDVEGSDFAAVSHNRVVGTGSIPIKLVAQGTFSNYDVVDHNDILTPSSGIDAYIYSSAREASITFNATEGTTNGAYMIHVDSGLLVTVADNGLVDASTTAAVGVTGDTWYKLDIHGNATVSTQKGSLVNGGTGLAVYNAGGNSIRQVMVHYGNGSEVGLPMNMDSSPNVPIGNVLLDVTPNSYLAPAPTNYGATVRVVASGLLTGQSPAWSLPALAGVSGTISFPDETPWNLKGTLSVCFKAASAPTQTFNVQLLDNGAPVSTPTVVTLNQGQPLYCPAGIQHVAIVTNLGVKFWNNDTGDGATVYLWEVIVNNG